VFYKSRLQDRFTIELIEPAILEQDIIHQAIYDELSLSKTLDGFRRQRIKIIEGLHHKGA
jgi:aspartate/glutamate racemase